MISFLINIICLFMHLELSITKSSIRKAEMFGGAFMFTNGLNDGETNGISFRCA